MAVLQKTIDYLLSLLDQPYDGNFLGRYNFLWDRMRAIQMDLRMQHSFNVEAITMLEQMIRLHVIAMHELCEYKKGEGFSEGFDAHLNIEHMNKTSVELFQMYDDHRKKGVIVQSVKEFRGYYALLKLDKHPGYKVEPSELSLDLAKMTPEIRQNPEVLFARNVARAFRTSNFIAFFRLAKKATYLQACLMHAHFAKLRTHALASLYLGLQTNQGIPVSEVAKWIAMEEEDVENLLPYYGFSIKQFEEPYMYERLDGIEIKLTVCLKLKSTPGQLRGKHILYVQCLSFRRPLITFLAYWISHMMATSLGAITMLEQMDVCLTLSCHAFEKKGIIVPSEKEFYGHYALLKLDKHRGCKVEPSELSLDLAKMTPEIRQTPEVLFARDVARACRTGNFIAFFRLAKRASYLQACLMHAHFAKLRHLALASLYLALQTNQGIPVSQVAKWLAMEQEDVENLLAYYGFSIKDFEEPYMVKEGPFLNSDKDFSTKCSRLVHLKKSTTIVSDISPSSQVTPLPAEATRKIRVPFVDKKNPSHTFAVKATPALVDKKNSISAINDEMPDSHVVVPLPKFGLQKQCTIGRSEVLIKWRQITIIM
ncbi:unnamed protein product [Linum trigynum]|uniref:PCI domain-containing protein n=1 Tax=Linum trigynum TaxID=586398 RepID=A0AAV2GRS2_9ROSI